MELFSNLVFRPINLELNLKEALSFREDSYLCSFGESGKQKYDEASGTYGEKYITYLKAKQIQDPFLAVHVWQGEQIIGQMELDAVKSDPSVGYINLYYLIPEVRGSGVSEVLDHYAVQFLKSKGHLTARLCVSRTNLRAVRYYTRMGWTDIGPRPNGPEVNYMEKDL